jgi:hypothetical protein
MRHDRETSHLATSIRSDFSVQLNENQRNRTILPGLGQPMVDALASYGLESMELFCAAGLDGREADCEIRISPLSRHSIRRKVRQLP